MSQHGPAMQGLAAPTPYAASTAGGPSVIRVLVVDPDRDTREMYRAVLQASGFDTDEAADGREALAKVFAVRPSAMVIETRLSFIDGYELCRILARDAVTADVPVLVVSGDSQPTQIERAWSAGADAVLTKPFRPDALIDEIRRVLKAPRDASRAPMATPTMPGAFLSPDPSHRMKVRAHRRFDTTQPPRTPPSLHCPSCDWELVYEHSHIGGVSAQHSEQWDYFTCTSCGTFEYRQRTKTLRRVVDVGAVRHL